MIRHALPLLLLAACQKPAPVPDQGPTLTSAGAVDPGAAARPPGAPRDLAGRWTGVEGMYLVVTPAGAGGTVRLEMQSDLDTRGTYDGRIENNTITFTRAGIRETLRPTNGDATGLKWLAGKTTCLTVKPGEGYCRD